MPRKKKPPQPQGTPGKAVCENCIYFHGRYDFSACCNYLFDTGKMRNCPPDENCTKFSPRNRE